MSLGILEWEGVSWAVLRRLAGENETEAVILGGGEAAEEEVAVWDLGFGAKKWEITCRFCFPMTAAAAKRRFCTRNMAFRCASAPFM